MKTKTVGEILKEERHYHRVNLTDLAKQSRIKLAYLKALENNQFEKLPASIFVKGYIKTYARIFGFEYQPVLALLRRDYKESAKGKLVPREFIRPVLKPRQLWTPITFLMLVLASVFLVLLGYVGLQWYNFNKPPALAIYAPTNEEFVAANVVVEGKTNPEAVVTVNDQPVALQTDGSFHTEVYLPQEGISTISVEATDRRGKSSLEQRTVYVRF